MHFRLLACFLTTNICIVFQDIITYLEFLVMFKNVLYVNNGQVKYHLDVSVFQGSLKIFT